MDTARELTAVLADLLRRERTALAEFLVALADFDAKRVWVELGYTSLFHFLRAELHLSKAAAQYRKVAAELLQRVPAVIEPLRNGRLCFTTIIEAAKVLTPENCATVLPRFYGMSRSDAMEVVAELQPHPAPPVRTVVTVPPSAARQVASLRRDDPGSPSPAPLPLVAAPEAITSATDSGSPVELAGSEVVHAPSRPAEVIPLNASDRRLHLTVSKRFLAKLAAAADALAHTRPGATEVELLEAGLDLLLAKAAKRHGQVDRPRKAREPANPDHVPAAVRRVVYERDDGKCQHRLANGEICGRTRHLEYDHVPPLALGGESTVDRVRLACRWHNVRAARADLGDAVMDRYTSNPRIPRPGAALRPGPSR